jgi:hypothetical protein
MQRQQLDNHRLGLGLGQQVLRLQEGLHLSQGLLLRSTLQQQTLVLGQMLQPAPLWPQLLCCEVLNCCCCRTALLNPTRLLGSCMVALIGYAHMLCGCGQLRIVLDVYKPAVATLHMNTKGGKVLDPDEQGFPLLRVYRRVILPHTRQACLISKSLSKVLKAHKSD